MLSSHLLSFPDCSNQERVDETVGKDFADHRERNPSKVITMTDVTNTLLMMFGKDSDDQHMITNPGSD